MEARRVKHMDNLKQKDGPWSEVPKHTETVKGAKQKEKEPSRDGKSRKNLMKMKVQFRTWQNFINCSSGLMCCYIISVTFAFFQMTTTHTTPSTKHAAQTPGNLDMPKMRKGSGGKMIKTLPKLRVSFNLTCFPTPSEMTKHSFANYD